MATPEEDQKRAAELREAEFRTAAERATKEAEAAKGKVAALKGERDAAHEEIEKLKGEIEQLKSANASLATQVSHDGLVPIPDLPDDAYQVVEPVTTHSRPYVAGPDGKKMPRRLDLQRGHVVFTEPSPKELEELRAQVGSSITVTEIDEDCETELRKLGAIR